MAGLTCCNLGAAECGAQPDSSVGFAGTVAIPDDAIESLTINACLDAECWTSTGVETGRDGGALQSDASSAPSGGWTVTQVQSGLYAISGTVVPLDSPTGSATSGTGSFTITSGSVVLYEQTALEVPCTQGPEGCGNAPSETCKVSLP